MLLVAAMREIQAEDVDPGSNQGRDAVRCGTRRAERRDDSGLSHGGVAWPQSASLTFMCCLDLSRVAGRGYGGGSHSGDVSIGSRTLIPVTCFVLPETDAP